MLYAICFVLGAAVMFCGATRMKRIRSPKEASGHFYNLADRLMESRHMDADEVMQSLAIANIVFASTFTYVSEEILQLAPEGMEGLCAEFSEIIDKARESEAAWIHINALIAARRESMGK